MDKTSLTDRLDALLQDDDLTDEKLREAADGLLPAISDYLHGKGPSADGLSLIAAERKRQIEVKKWTPEHDAMMHQDSELAIAAAAYALPENFSIKERLRGRLMHGSFEVYRQNIWPFGYKWWRPSPDDRIKELAKAGALIVAEIERLQRIGGIE